MKIDLSAIAVVLLFVAPGYFAYWTRNHFAPRQLSPKGPTEEFAGFVVISAVVHALAALILLPCGIVTGVFAQKQPLFVFRFIDQTDLQAWVRSHLSAAIAAVIVYFLLSCGLGAILGLPLALSELGTGGAWPLRWLQQGKLGIWLNRHGIRGLLTEHPIIYEALRPELDEYGTQKIVFIEAELRDGKGFYIGQVASYSVGRDEDPHKLVLLKDTQFSPDATSDYQQVRSETMLLDLADVLILRIRQHAKDETNYVQPGTSSGIPSIGQDENLAV